LKKLSGIIYEDARCHTHKITESVKIRNAIIETVKMETADRPERKFNDKKNVLVFNNCILEIDKKTFEIKIEDIDKNKVKDLYITEKIRIDYDPNITESEYILPGLNMTVLDKDSLRIMQQFSGIFLFKDFLQKILWLKGEGGDGKSFYLGVMQHILGNLVSNFSLEALTNDHFSRAELFGKTLNIAQEVDAKEKIKETTLKLLSGDDFLNADRKYRSTIKFKNEAMLVFSGNNFPVFMDTSRGLARRPVFIEFNEIPLDKQETNYFGKYIANNDKELSAFVNWCIAGYIDYLKNGLWNSEQSEKIKMEIRGHSDSVADYWKYMFEKINDSLENDLSLGLNDKFFDKVNGKVIIDHIAFYGTSFRLWSILNKSGEKVSQKLFTHNSIRFIEQYLRSCGYNVQVASSNPMRIHNDAQSYIFVENFKDKIKSDERYMRIMFNYDMPIPRRVAVITGPDADKSYQVFSGANNDFF